MAKNVREKAKIINRKALFNSFKEAKEVQWPEIIEKHNNIMPDQLKEKLFLSAKNEVTKLKILCLIKKDVTKMKLYEEFKKMLKVDSDRATFCKSLKSDDAKEKVLAEIHASSYRAEAISTFKNDKLKKAYIDSLEEELDKATVVASYKSFKAKQSSLESFSLPYARIKIIASSEKLKEIHAEELNKYIYENRTSKKFLASLKLNIPSSPSPKIDTSSKATFPSIQEKFDD